MRLDLCSEDIPLLRQSLDMYLNETRDELAHTSDRQYKDELRNVLKRLQEIRRRIDSASERKRAA